MTRQTTLFLVAAMSLFSNCGVESETQEAKSSIVLQSRTALDSYLESNAQTPLDVLSVGGRQRFLDSLVFSERGLAGYVYIDLKKELTADQTSAILALFGVEGGAEVVAPTIRGGVGSSSQPLLPPGSENDMYCASRGSCAPRLSWICTSNC